MNDVQAALRDLKERTAVLYDIGAVERLLSWDQMTTMPSKGTAGRAAQIGAINKIQHDMLTDPELGRLLEILEPWANDEDPDSDDARIIHWSARDFKKAIQVPSSLVAEMSHAGVIGEQTWEQARAKNDFNHFRDALSTNIELARRYADCFSGFESPYDAMLDDYEPDMTVAELNPIFARIADRLTALVEAAQDADSRNAGVLSGKFPVDIQERALVETVTALGFDSATTRIDVSAHPFCSGIAAGDTRITTAYDEADFGVAFYSLLHEFGHGLYEDGINPDYYRTALGYAVSLGVHESQSRMWENFVGRSKAFCQWVLPRLQTHFSEQLGGLDVDRLYHGVNTVQRSPIRIYADETTYNLHIILRYELEQRLINEGMPVADLPEAWNEGMERLLGVTVADDASGVLQDMHWSDMNFGYFPTYSLGNIIAAQLWRKIEATMPIDEQMRSGDFAPLREWLRTNIHQYGRKYTPAELLERITGEVLDPDPLIDYLTNKLQDAGVIDVAKAP